MEWRPDFGFSNRHHRDGWPEDCRGKVDNRLLSGVCYSRIGERFRVPELTTETTKKPSSRAPITTPITITESGQSRATKSPNQNKEAGEELHSIPAGASEKSVGGRLQNPGGASSSAHSCMKSSRSDGRFSAIRAHSTQSQQLLDEFRLTRRSLPGGFREVH